MFSPVPPPHRYRLRELARLVGLEPRTIRSYIQQVVIPGPDHRGRNARYGPEHVDFLRAIVFLRNHRGLSLPAIRRLLPSLSEAEIRGIPRGLRILDPVAGSGAIPIIVDALMRNPPFGRVAGRGTARYADYVRTRAKRRVAQQSSSPSRSVATAFDNLLGYLQPEAHAESVPRAARGEFWVRIAITPDVELNVRNVTTAEALGALVRIADHIRYLLLHPRYARGKSPKRS